LLRRRGPIVHVVDDAPVALQHVAGDVVHPGDGQSGDVHSVDAPLVDVPGIHRQAVALVAVGILAHPAGTEDLAGTDLEELPLERVGHRLDLLRKTRGVS
jgi:hypothetical protein